MTVMDLVMLIGCLIVTVGPLHLLIQYQLSREIEPDFIREQGVVLPAPDACDDRGPIIGFFDGVAIHASVIFLGLRYEYDRIAPTRYRGLVRANELFVGPGLIYVNRP
jgi:hypothetical protein